ARPDLRAGPLRGPGRSAARRTGTPAPRLRSRVARRGRCCRDRGAHGRNPRRRAPLRGASGGLLLYRDRPGREPGRVLVRPADQSARASRKIGPTPAGRGAAAETRGRGSLIARAKEFPRLVAPTPCGSTSPPDLRLGALSTAGEKRRCFSQVLAFLL